MRPVSNAGLQAYLIEFLAPKIVEKKIPGGIVRNEYIHEAVVIVIRERNAHALAHFPGDPSLLRYIRESPIAIISIKRIVQRSIELGMAVPANLAIQVANGILIYFPLTVIDHEKIQQAVIVVVKPA